MIYDLGYDLLSGLGITDFPITTFEQFNLSSDQIIITNWMNDQQMYQAKAFLERGARFVFNGLWECLQDPKSLALIQGHEDNGIMFVGCKQDSIGNMTTYQVPMFFWYSESLNCKRYRRTPGMVSKKFLMPINNYSKQRHKIMAALADQLHEAIYSYRSKNISLPNDCEPFNDRFINIDWYNDTSFSLVVESEQEQTDRVFLTEKTFKPIAMGHPFLIFGHLRSLKLLMENGFKTFSSMFDESYDDIVSVESRMEAIVKQVREFDIASFIDEETIAHNVNHFYDHDLVKQRIQEEITAPLRNFING